VEFAGGVDQQVGKNGTISVNYLHTQGVHQFATQNIGYNFADPAASTAQYQFFSEGKFNQNQLIVHGRVQTTKAISLFGYYSLNSAHGDTSGATSDITDPGNIAADYGRTTFDVKNRIFLAGSITLPKYIQFSPFFLAQSGTPYNITTGSDNNQDTFYNDRAEPGDGMWRRTEARSSRSRDAERLRSRGLWVGRRWCRSTIARGHRCTRSTCG
jgi:hypothetical protein